MSNDEANFMWKIENCSHCVQKTGEPLGSPIFTSNALDQTRWRLWLYPKGMIDNNDTALELVRYLDDSGPESLTVNCKLSFLDSSGSPIEERETIDREFSVKDFWNCNDFLKPDLIFGLCRSEYLPNDTLSIRCNIWRRSKKISKIDSQIGRTLIGAELRSFMWDIKNFDCLQKGYRTSMKVEPVLEHLPSLKFSFFLEKSGDDYCFEVILDEPRRIVSIICNISIVNDQRKSLVSAEYDHRFECSTCNQYWRFPLFMTKTKILENKHIYLVKNALFLRIDCTISAGVVSSDVKNISVNLKKETTMCSDKPKCDKQCMTDAETPESFKEFISDLRCMFEEGILSDFRLRVGTKTFHVHKSILSARSSVFKFMFTDEMKSGSSHIVDVDKVTLQRMLLYIYTDVTEDMDWEASCKLYSAADLYGIETLKRRCSSILKSSVRASNVCELLALTDAHQDKDLKSFAKEFIKVNFREISGTDQWKTFQKEHFRLSIEVLYIYGSKQTTKTN